MTSGAATPVFHTHTPHWTLSPDPAWSAPPVWTADWTELVWSRPGEAPCTHHLLETPETIVISQTEIVNNNLDNCSPVTILHEVDNFIFSIPCSHPIHLKRSHVQLSGECLIRRILLTLQMIRESENQVELDYGEHIFLEYHFRLQKIIFIIIWNKSPKQTWDILSPPDSKVNSCLLTSPNFLTDHRTRVKLWTILTSSSETILTILHTTGCAESTEQQ